MTQVRGKKETVFETRFVISRSLFSLMLQLCATAFIPCSSKSDVILKYYIQPKASSKIYLKVFTLRSKKFLVSDIHLK